MTTALTPQIGTLEWSGAVSAPAPRAETAETELERQRNRALCHDLLQPYIADYSCFSRIMAAEATPFWGRPRMFDLACGTGLITLPVLAAVPHLDYYGFDSSEPMIRVFRHKSVKVEGPRRVIKLAAPLDPRSRLVPPSAYGGTAELVLAAHLLQHVPLAASSEDSYNRVGMLRFARELTRPGGKLFIIEEVFGESGEHHAHCTTSWNQAMVDRIRGDFPILARAVGALDPEMRELLGRVLSQASLAETLRERLQREPDRQLLPLAAWCRTFEHLGWRYNTYRHESVENLCLFVIHA